jgi:hypothetical protein
MEYPITYPKDCYPRTGYTWADGTSLPKKVKVTSEQYKLIITEIRAWNSPNPFKENVHMELNLGSHFKIKEN